MNITINRNINEALECYKIQVKIHTKASLISGGLFFLLGVICIIICQNDFGVTDTSLFVYLFLECVIFIFSYLIFKGLYKTRKTYRDFLVTAASKHEDNDTYSTIILDDAFFSYESKGQFCKLSWNFFKGYKMVNGNFVLHLGNKLDHKYLIRPQELTSNDLFALNTFLFKNLKPMK